MLLLLGCVHPVPVVTTVPLPAEIVSEARTMVVTTKVVADDEYHYIVAVTPTVRVDRTIAEPVETRTTLGATTTSEVARSLRQVSTTIAWAGAVQVTAEGQVIGAAGVDDGVARVDVRMERWVRTATIEAGAWRGTLDFGATTFGAAGLGRHVVEAVATGHLDDASGWMATVADVPTTAAALRQRWCEAALGPARLAAARDDFDRFAALLVPADRAGACQKLRENAGDVASVQAGLALGSGDRELAGRWVVALRAAGEEDRAGRLELGLQR